MKQSHGWLVIFLLIPSLLEARVFARLGLLGSVSPVGSSLGGVLALTGDSGLMLDNGLSLPSHPLSLPGAISLGATSARVLPIYQNGGAGIEFQVSF